MANTILLLSDEHNPRFSSPYGHPTIRTPNMERLAAGGVVFENACCPSPLCVPSRSAFMAGKRIHELQTYNNCRLEMRRDRPTWGRVLAERGVHTAHIGKTHVYDKGVNLGFSEMKLPWDGGSIEGQGDANIRRDPLAIREQAHLRAGNWGPKVDHSMEEDIEVMDAALEWLNGRAPGIEEPWVLSVNLHKPHFPHFAPQEFWDMYPDGGDLPAHGPEAESARHPYAQDLRAHFRADKFNEEQTRGLRRGYLAVVSWVDWQLGRILEALEKTGGLANTNVIYGADHGEMLGKFGMWWKCTLYEDSVRVPLIAAGPDFRKGARTATPVDLHDLRAMLFSAAGQSQPDLWLGTPLAEVPQRDDERVVFSEYHGHGTRSGAFMVRKGDWKLIYYMAAPHQLFNLAGDPDELNNLYATKPDKARELEAALREICSPEDENRRADEFIKGQLEAIARMGKD